MRDHHIEELWGWACALGEPGLSQDLVAHRSWLEPPSQPYTDLEVEVLGQTRVPGHGYSIPARLQFRDGFFWRDHGLASLETLQHFGPTVVHGTLVGNRVVGWVDNQLTEYDILSGRYGARWFRSRAGGNLLIQNGYLFYQKWRSLTCYSLAQRREVWDRPGYGGAFRVDDRHIGASKGKDQVDVIEASSGQVRAELPGAGRFTNQGQLSLVTNRKEGWCVIDRENWALLHSHSPSGGKRPRIREAHWTPAWWKEGQVEFEGTVWDARSGAALGSSGLNEVDCIYGLYPRGPWYRWLHKRGLFTPERAVGLGVWEDPIRAWEVEQDGKPSGSEKSPRCVTMAMREVGECVHLLLAVCRDLIHLRVTPVSKAAARPQPARPLEELGKTLLSEVAPSRVNWPWHLALKDPETRQDLLERGVLPGTELGARIIADFLRGQPLSDWQYQLLYDFFTPEIELELWQRFLALDLESTLLGKVVEDLVAHPDGERLSQGVDPARVEPGLRPLLRFLRGEAVGAQELKDGCRWEVWSALEQRVANRLQADKGVDTGSLLSLPPADLVRRLCDLKEWSERAQEALPALEFEFLQTVGAPAQGASPPVTICGSGDFIIQDRSSFNVWWDGDWWDSKVEIGTISPDGSSLARVWDEHLELWRRGENEPAWRVPCSARELLSRARLEFNQKASLLAVGGWHSTSVYDALSGEKLLEKSDSPRDADRLLLGDECVILSRNCYRMSAPDTVAQSGCCGLGPGDLLVTQDGQRLMVGDQEVSPVGTVLQVDSVGIWIEREDGLWLWSTSKGLVRVPLEGWSSKACQMFDSIPEADLLIRDWGVWHRSSGLCLRQPRPVLDHRARGLDYFSARVAGYDSRRGRLLLRHPAGPLECYRAMPQTRVEDLIEQELQHRIASTSRKEERALWNLILDLKRSL